jgi:uncharacterized PurR-regulated membrane protein YhhQ (DUF165 family)
MKALGIVALAVYVGVIVAANWAISKFGIVPVGFGLAAPAGVYFVGIAFTARDVIQRQLGRLVVVIAILAGAGLSYGVSSGRVAVASGIAFFVSESADFAVYTPLEKRGWTRAVVASNIVGVLVDSWVFLTVAFGSLAFYWGQVVGKLWLTLGTVIAVGAARAAHLKLRSGS